MILIFDWDGTLCDSTGKIVRCLESAAAEVGMPVLTEEQYKNIIGLGLPEAVQTLYPEISAEQSAALRTSYSRIFLQEDKTPSPFYDGVEETLHQFRDAGYTLTIATGKSRKGLDRVLNEKALMGFFHGSRCADETESKPHPKMLHELLSEFRFEAHEAVMVGDTEFDMEMARRADMDRIAVSYGAHHVDRLHPFEPVHSVDFFPDITGFILNHRKLGVS